MGVNRFYHLPICRWTPFFHHRFALQDDSAAYIHLVRMGEIINFRTDPEKSQSDLDFKGNSEKTNRKIGIIYSESERFGGNIPELTRYLLLETAWEELVVFF